MMAKRLQEAKRPTKEKQSGKKQIVVTLSIAAPEGADLVFDKGASNHYTDTSQNSNTCCTCE